MQKPKGKSKTDAKTMAIPKPKVPTDETIQEMKSFLKITPMTVRHLYAMGFTSVESLARQDITAETLNGMFKAYLSRKFPGKKPFNYTVACRRILWAAKATPEERSAHPEKFQCKSWSNKALGLT